MRMRNKKIIFFLKFWILVCLSLGTGSVVFSQEAGDEASLLTNSQNQLIELNEVISTKLFARDQLREIIKTAEADDIPVQQGALDNLNEEIVELRAAFEQIAVGDSDVQLFDDQPETVDWRDELTQIMMPLTQNLKRITEKPRKIETQRSRIAIATEQQQVANNAVLSIQKTLESTTDPDIVSALTELNTIWVERKEDVGRDINAASIQLANLQRSDSSLFSRSKQSLIDFFTGRGLTLVIAAVVASLVWFGMKLLTNLFSKKVQGEDIKSFRTRQRIVHYGLKILAVVLAILAVMIVFYSRGDILLMGLSLLIVAGSVVGLRNTIPKFATETRLLLNLGSIREDERVVYQGVPWKVVSLNVQSLLKNPEITGVVRLPMEEMLGLVSRPAGKESWFPASRNDFIMLEDGLILKVNTLTPERVLLEDLAGTARSIPTTDFFNLTFDNLTRSKTYMTSSVFGVGYSHQQDSVVEIPQKINEAVSMALAASDLADEVVSVTVELQEAGASSLDYWIGIKMKSSAASSYYRIKRLVQQVCVATCSKENWDIPFPQLTLHKQ